MIRVLILSFGYCYGAPKHHDLLYNLRGYPAPQASTCKRYDGTHSNLQNELLCQEEYQTLLQTIEQDLRQALERYEDSLDDAQIVVAVGCEEGRHRSVAVVEHVINHMSAIRTKCMLSFTHEHRDLHRKREQKAKQQRIGRERADKYRMAEADN